MNYLGGQLPGEEYLLMLFIRPQPVSPERSVLCQGRITLSLRHSVSKNCVPFLGSHCPILTKIGKWLRLSSNKKDQVSFWT